MLSAAIALGAFAYALVAGDLVRSAVALALGTLAFAGLLATLGTPLSAALEAVVGVGLTSALFLVAVTLTPHRASTAPLRPAWPVLLVVGALGVALALVVMAAPAAGWPSSAARRVRDPCQRLGAGGTRPPVARRALNQIPSGPRRPRRAP